MLALPAPASIGSPGDDDDTATAPGSLRLALRGRLAGPRASSPPSGLDAIAAQRRTARILREFVDLAKPRNRRRARALLPNEADCGEWRVLLAGPDDTPYAGGVYNLVVEFPSGYANIENTTNQTLM
jgi:hypothetical protein